MIVPTVSNESRAGGTHGQEPAGLAAGVFTLLRFCLIAWRRRRESA